MYKKIEQIGFDIIDIKEILPEFFLGKGVFTKFLPEKKIFKDIEKGLKILNEISKFDIGQSIILQRGTVVGIEGAEGTDILIKNSRNYLKHDNGGVLVKSVKKTRFKS